jgi:outer membrane protein
MSHASLLRPALALSLFAFAAHGALAAPDGATVTVAAGVAVVPEYSGSDKSTVKPVIGVDYQNSNGFFASTLRGIGYTTAIDGFKLSGALSYGGGRDESKRTFGSGSDALRGMGKIDNGALAALGIGYDFGAVQLGVNTHLALSNRDRGNTVELAIGTPLVKSASDQVSLGATAKYGDSKYTQTYYGVTALQSSRSGYRAYQAGAGFTSAQLGATWRHVIDKNWSVNTVAGVTHLVGDAADSPLVKRATSPLLVVTAGYTF